MLNMDLNDLDDDLNSNLIYVIEVNGESFDLSNIDDAYNAFHKAREARQDLRDGELEEYEGKDTEYGGGGRTELLRDELLTRMAIDYHQGHHDLNWNEQRAETERIISIRAAKIAHLWRK